MKEKRKEDARRVMRGMKTSFNTAGQEYENTKKLGIHNSLNSTNTV